MSVIIPTGLKRGRSRYRPVYDLFIREVRGDLKGTQCVSQFSWGMASALYAGFCSLLRVGSSLRFAGSCCHDPQFVSPVECTPGHSPICSEDHGPPRDKKGERCLQISSITHTAREATSWSTRQPPTHLELDLVLTAGEIGNEGHGLTQNAHARRHVTRSLTLATSGRACCQRENRMGDFDDPEGYPPLQASTGKTEFAAVRGQETSRRRRDLRAEQTSRRFLIYRAPLAYGVDTVGGSCPSSFLHDLTRSSEL